MELIFEFIFELLFEGSISLSKNKKVPKTIRYLLIMLLLLFCICIIGFIFFISILVLKENIFAGIFIILFGIILLISMFFKFKKLYFKKYDND